MRFYASTADTVIPKASHTDVMAALVAATTPESTVVARSGDHGDPSAFPADRPGRLPRKVWHDRWSPPSPRFARPPRPPPADAGRSTRGRRGLRVLPHGGARPCAGRPGGVECTRTLAAAVRPLGGRSPVPPGGGGRRTWWCSSGPLSRVKFDMIRCLQRAGWRWWSSWTTTSATCINERGVGGGSPGG